MVKKINRLSARKVASLTKPGRHADGAGLYLRIDPSGAKRWVFLWERTIAARRVQREAGLGSVNAVPLAKAREIAASFRAALADGLNPLDARQKARSAQAGRKTFGQVADSFLAAKAHGWRNAKHRAQWRTTLEIYAAPLWPMPAAEVDTAAVLAVLQRIWQAKPETASRLRGRIEAVLDAARVAGHLGADRQNPARWKGHLEKILPAKKLSRGHHAAMPYADVPCFVQNLRGQNGTAARALEFLILTAGRTGEVLGTRWREIDLDAKVWTVPAWRMKAGREHRVPLSSHAAAILEKAALHKTGDFVFPGQNLKKHLSNMALEMALRRMKIAGATVHGFRSSFRDWAGDKTNFPREVAEAALAHVAGDATEQAYRRGDALEKRHALMEDWAAFCEPGWAARQ
ncbi:MAG: tyrosine-type recombinase/integrase [Methylocella sp.]